MRYPFFSSIRTKLVALVFIAILPALGVIVYSGSELRRHSINDAKDKALMVLHSLVNEHEQAVEGTRLLLVTLSKIPDIRNLNVPACNRILGGVLAESPMYANLFLATAQGMVVSSAQPFKPHSIVHRKYFQDVIQAKRLSVGEYVVGVTAKRPVLHFAYPVLDAQGRVEVIIAAAVDLARYGESFSKTRLPEGSVFTLTDYKGIRLYRYPDPEKYAGKADLPDRLRFMSGAQEEGIMEAAGDDRFARIIAYRRFRLSENQQPYLFMRVGIPENIVLSHARKVLIVSLTLFGCAFLAAMLLAWFAGKAMIVRNINKLTDAAERLGKGNLTARTGLHHVKGEIGQLAKAFDEMAEELGNSGEALRLSEKKYRNIFENAIEGIFQSTPDGRLLNINPAFARIYGFDSPQEMLEAVSTIGQMYIDVDDRQSFKEILEEKGRIEDHQAERFRKDGSRIWVSANAQAVYSSDGPIIFYEGTIEDITDRKLAEELIKSSLREKEMLLREVHHRVKNNLAAIIALMEMQRQTMDDPEAASALKGLGARVKAMALVHEKLYQSESLSRIDFRGYIEALISNLRTSFSPDSDIIYTVTAEGITIGLDIAVPCGMMINELITNTIKHAFPDGKPRPGESHCGIVISMEYDGSAYTLIVADNGVGLPADFNWETTKSLGLRLVWMLGQHQLQGQIEIDRTTGTRFTLLFGKE